MEGAYASGAVLRVEDLSVRFTKRDRSHVAVSGIGFELGRGEVLTIVGESGSGKSVTLRALLGLLPNYAEVTGQMTVVGRTLGKYSTRSLRSLRGRFFSLIFQEPATAFDPVYTIGQQIAETIIERDGLSKADAMRRARELLDRVAIPSAERRLLNYPHELSGGMLQRAMIAMALANRPVVLLADEPTTALDATVQIQVLLLLRELQAENGMAMVFVTHDVAVAAEISDQVAVMYAGRFVERGPVRTVLRNPAHPYTHGLLISTVRGKKPGSVLETIPGHFADLDTANGGCTFAARCRYATDRCTAAPVPAVDVEHGHAASCLYPGVAASADRTGSGTPGMAPPAGALEGRGI